MSIGQEVKAKILEIDKERKRISLSIKETLDADDQAIPEEDAEAVSEPVADAEDSAE